VERVPANLGVTVAYPNGDKLPARIIDLGIGGMHLEAERAPEYGDAVTVVVRFDESADSIVLQSTVRWFSRNGFGVAFAELSPAQHRALSAFIGRAA
jgi:hypothetical protein